MTAQTNKWKLGAFAHRLIMLPALVVALSLASTAAASAPPAFQATVNGIHPKTEPPCPTSFCGTASIAGYGSATWTLDVLSNPPVSTACPRTGLVSVETYQATTTFTIPANGVYPNGSTLVLDESGLVCAPGNSYPGPPSEVGVPLYAEGNWTVESASGAFSGLTGGGTDTLHSAGARISGTYSGT